MRWPRSQAEGLVGSHHECKKGGIKTTHRLARPRRHNKSLYRSEQSVFRVCLEFIQTKICRSEQSVFRVCLEFVQTKKVYHIDLLFNSTQEVESVGICDPR